MGMEEQQMEKKFTYCLGNTCYSRPYSLAGCNWYLSACPKGDYLCLSLELEPESLPPGWRRDVKFSFTLGSDDDDNTSKEATDDLDDDGASSHVSNNGDDTSEEASEDGDASKDNLADNYDDDDDDDDDGPLSQSNALEDVSPLVGNHVVSCNGLAAETEVSNGENTPKEDVDDEATSLVSDDSARNGSSLHQVKSLKDASQTVENGGGGRGLNNVVSVTETCNNVFKEIQPVKETKDVNGFQVFSSQVESVSYIFKRHPDITSDFRPKNQQIRRAYMNELLSLIEMLCQSPEKLSEDDLSNDDDTLADLIDVGFRLDWLKTKMNEVSEKKKKEQSSGTRLKTMEEELLKLKLMFLDLETQLQMEKAEALAARAPPPSTMLFTDSARILVDL
ncbi:hypothetical protein Rs2_35133 [Raphanus sativus]|nr:hypothetical protein Rs2_35133 [Raphanus sativus]